MHTCGESLPCRQAWPTCRAEVRSSNRLANGQRSHWVGRFMRFRPSVPPPGDWSGQRELAVSHQCVKPQTGTHGVATDWVTSRSSQAEGSMYSRATVSYTPRGLRKFL